MTISNVFLNATIGNDYFRILPIIAIVCKNDDHRRCFSEDYLVKIAQNGI